MKKILISLSSILVFCACDKEYVCNCAHEEGGLPYKKVYLVAKSEKGAERKCTKEEAGVDFCVLQ